jgi:hypothetical protein
MSPISARKSFLAVALLACGACTKQNTQNVVQASVAANSAATALKLASVGKLAHPMTPDQMAELRRRGWKLLQLVDKKNEGALDPAYWTQVNVAYAADPKATSGLTSARYLARDKTVPLLLSVAEEQKALAVAPTRRLWESTFYNPILYRYVRDHNLYKPGTSVSLLEQNLRDIVVPTGSIAVKTFWYLLQADDPVDIALWNWNSLPAETSTLPAGTMKKTCVAIPAEKYHCLSPDRFYKMTVSDPSAFVCPLCTTPLQPGQQLVMVAMHVASKQLPDWFWATFWWRGDDSHSGKSWTCDDAQRAEVAPEPTGVWKRYSMDVIAGFYYAKPTPTAGEDCGTPAKIGNSEQYLAMYNPFVEALFQNGLKSNCIDCHARASSDGRAILRTSVPPVGEDDPYTQTSNFEGQIRSDYLWTLAGHLRHTTYPPSQWPPSPH